MRRLVGDRDGQRSGYVWSRQLASLFEKWQCPLGAGGSFRVLLGAVLGLVLGAQQQVLLRAALFVLGAEVFVARTAEDQFSGRSAR